MSEGKKSGDSLIGLGYVLVVALIIGIVGGIYQWVDSIGWIPHTEESVITAKENWFVGESKDCNSYPMDAKVAQTQNKDSGYTLGYINCDGGPEHNVRITFYGRESQPEYTWVNWRCTRRQDSFDCKETGAVTWH